MKRLLVPALALMLLTSGASIATASANIQTEPSSTEIIFDISLMRPMGVAMTVLGVGCYVVGLPWTTITRSSGQVAKALITDPFKFTFVRPVGEF